MNEQTAQRKQDLYNKQQEEENKKRERKASAQQELSTWKQTRENQIKQRTTNNVIEEK